MGTYLYCLPVYSKNVQTLAAVARKDVLLAVSPYYLDASEVVAFRAM